MKDSSFKLLYAAMQLTDTVDEITYNLDHQSVSIPTHTPHKTQESKQCVYRIEFDDKVLVGSIFLKGEWHRVVYDETLSAWRIQNS